MNTHHQVQTRRTKATLFIPLLLPFLGLLGCAAPSSKFQNANGQVVDCSASGFGIFGTLAAVSMHSDCEKRAQDSGYRPVNASSVEPKRSSLPSTIQVAWPAGWTTQGITEAQANVGVVAYSLDKSRDLGAQVSIISSEGIHDRLAYASSRRANQAGRLKGGQGGEIARMSVGGRDAMRFEVTGQLASGLPVTYMITIIEGEKQLAYVSTWASTPNFATHREELTDIATRVSGIQ